VNETYDGFMRGWNALRVPDGWALVEPVVDEVRGRATLASCLPSPLPQRLVVVTAANPGGIALDAAENLERHARLIDRVHELEPFPASSPVVYETVGGAPVEHDPLTWGHREDGVALEISRDEAAILAIEFGQLAYYSFEGSHRLLLGAGDEGVLAAQRYRIHHV